MTGAPFPSQKPRSFRTSRTVGALMIREMSTTYGRTAFGYLWAIVEPAAGIMLLTLVFSLALRTPGLGSNFPLYYASGLLPFLTYMDISAKTAQSLRFSKPLMSLPVVTFVDTLLARLFLNGLTQLMVTALVLMLIMQVYQLDEIVDYTEVLSAMLMAISLGFGVGTLNCYLFLRFPSWERIWGIAMRPIFFISCIFFLFETVPPPYNSYLWFNPLVHITGLFRRGVYPTYDAPYVSLPYVMGLSLILLVFGFLLLRQYHRDLLNQ